MHFLREKYIFEEASVGICCGCPWCGHGPSCDVSGFGSEPQQQQRHQKAESCDTQQAGDRPTSHGGDRALSELQSFNCFHKISLSFPSSPQKEEFVTSWVANKQVQVPGLSCPRALSVTGIWFSTKYRRGFAQGVAEKEIQNKEQAHVHSMSLQLKAMFTSAFPSSSSRVAGVLKTDGCFAEGIINPFKFICSRSAYCIRHKVWKKYSWKPQ